MARPLKLDGSSGLKEMTDAELERICYYLRVAYSTQLNATGDGSIFVGGTGTTIGTAVDTSSTEQTASATRNYNPADGTDYPAAPGIGVETDTSYTYKQDRTVPSFPSTSTLDASGFMIIDGTSGIRTVNTEAQIYSEIITQAIAEMRTGDEVGTYRVATTSPGAGWVDKGTWFIDTTYSAGSTTYKLWLKTSATEPGTLVRPIILDSTTGVKEATGTFDATHGMVTNVLLPALTRRLDDGDLNYTVATSSSGVARGTFVNTRQTSSSTSYSFSDPTYYTTSTPSGTATTVTTYYLNLA